MLNAIGWIFAGLLVGAIARLLIPGRQPMGVLGTIALGIVGALAGGAAAHAMWGEQGGPFDASAWPGYFTAILGAAIVLWLWLKFAAKKA